MITLGDFSQKRLPAKRLTSQTTSCSKKLHFKQYLNKYFNLLSRSSLRTAMIIQNAGS